MRKFAMQTDQGSLLAVPHIASPPFAESDQPPSDNPRLDFTTFSIFPQVNKKRDSRLRVSLFIPPPIRDAWR